MNNCMNQGIFAPTIPTYVTQVTENDISVGEDENSFTSSSSQVSE